MYIFECIDKIYKQGSNVVIAYKLLDVYTGKVMKLTKDELKLSIKNRMCMCINLQLTSDNRLIDKKKNNSSNIQNYCYYLNKCRALGVKPYLECNIDPETDRVSLVKVREITGNTFTIPSYITDIVFEKETDNKRKLCYGPFSYCEETDYVKVYNNSKHIKSIKGLFVSLRAKYVDLSEMNTYNINDMSRLFEYADISEIKFGGKFNTSNVTNMSKMFLQISVVKLDISQLDTSRVEDMSEMFADCCSLEQLNIKGIKTKNVKTFFRMFANCVRLKELDLSSFDTSNAENTMMMFDNARSLTRLDTSNFNISNVKIAYMMYKNTTNIKEIILPYCGISDNIVLSELISNSSVVAIDLGCLAIKSIQENIITECRNLKYVRIHGKNLWNEREIITRLINSIMAWAKNNETNIIIDRQYVNENELINYIMG